MPERGTTAREQEGREGREGGEGRISDTVVAALPGARGTAALRRTGLLVTLILGGLTATPPLAMDMYLPSLPEVTRSLHAPAATVQLTLTACLAGMALGQLVVGPMSDRWGRRRPLLVGLLTAKTLVDWQAIQFYRAEWLLGATASFVAGILLKKASNQEPE